MILRSTGDHLLESAEIVSTMSDGDRRQTCPQAVDEHETFHHDGTAIAEMKRKYAECKVAMDTECDAKGFVMARNGTK